MDVEFSSAAFSASTYMIFILQFVNTVYNIDGFVDIEPPLHPWDKSHLVIVYDPFNVFLNSVC